MGTSSSPGELVRKLSKAGGAIDGAARDGVFKAALLVKTSVLSEMHTTRLRGVGKKGAKIGVRFDVKGTKNPTALIRATGPFHLLERDTKAHDITPKKKKKALSIPGVGPRASAHHPGSRGKHPWEKGIKRVDGKIPQVIMREQAASLRRFFS